MTSEMLDWKIQTDVTRVKTIWYTDIKWMCTLQSGGAKKKSQPNLCFLVAFTVVKWGHTEGIEREKTLSEKYTVIFLDFWRDKLFLVFQIWGQNTFGGQFLEHCHLIWNCPWFLKRFLIFQIWGQYLQKVNAKCPQISDEKDKFFFHWYVFFSLF